VLIRLISFLILLPVLALSQQQEAEQVLIIDKLMGLNTRAGTFMLLPNELVVGHNIDYGDIGVYKKRKGYDSVSVLNGMDSIVDGGIFAVAYNDGTQQLVIVADSDGVGYGAVYLSPLGSANIKDSATKIWDYFSVQNEPSFEQYLDRVYIGNGSHRPIVYDKNSGLTRQVPPRAPGEPLIVPLNTAGDLDGEYVYRASVKIASNTTTAGYADGIISGRIKVSNGQVRLSHFPRPVADSLQSPWRVRFTVDIDLVENNKLYYFHLNVASDSVEYLSDANATAQEIAEGLRDEANTRDTIEAWSYTPGLNDGWCVYVQSSNDYAGYRVIVAAAMSDYLTLNGDSAWQLQVHRTNANPSVLDYSDSAFVVLQLNIDYDDTLAIDTLWFIDSIADDAYSAVLFTDNYYGRDSTFNLVYRYGASGFVSGSKDVSDSSAYGVYGGWPLAQSWAYGMAYACTFIDTITGLESDTSRTCVIWKSSADRDDSTFTYTISIPRLPDGGVGFKVNLYRSILGGIVNDTSWLVDSSGPDRLVFGDDYTRASWEKEKRLVWVHTLTLDSVYFSQFVQVAQLDDTVRTYVDNMRYDSLVASGVAIRPEYSHVGSPPLMKGMFTFQNRMFAFQGSRLYYSDLDFELGGQSINDWREWNIIIVGEGDGDEIVYAHPARDYIRVFKHNSSYIVYQGDDGFQLRTAYDGIWPHVDYVGAYGCLSPQSFVDAPGGSYYLSNLGVLRESAGQQLARQRDIQLASAKLDNFDNLSISDKEDAVAAYVPHEQRYLLCMGDTTYNYDIRADAWSTWDMTFSGSALYRVESAVDNYPGDTLYFIKPGDSVLYRYGTSLKDNGTSFLMEWKTAPLLANNTK